MARKNRRDCRTGERKKTAANHRRDEQIREIRKQRKSACPLYSVSGTCDREDSGAAAPSAKSAAAAASFLNAMSEQVRAESEETRGRLRAATATSLSALAASKKAPAEVTSSE